MNSAETGQGRDFLALHVPGQPLLMPNAWDRGSAKLFAAMGLQALATTSGGFAITRGKVDGAMTKDEVLAHVADLAAATPLPLSADLENCFAHEPDGVADTIRAAVAAGVAGASVEDFVGGDRPAEPIYQLAQATERVRAAADAAHNGGRWIALTARAENYLHGRKDLADTITRLQAYQEAGADVLFAPRVIDPAELRTLLAAVDVPVSVLVLPGAPSIPELAELGVARISVGGAVAAAAYGAAMQAIEQLRDEGTTGYWELAGHARSIIADHFDR